MVRTRARSGWAFQPAESLRVLTLIPFHHRSCYHIYGGPEPMDLDSEDLVDIEQPERVESRQPVRNNVRRPQRIEIVRRA